MPEDKKLVMTTVAQLMKPGFNIKCKVKGRMADKTANTIILKITVLKYTRMENPTSRLTIHNRTTKATTAKDNEMTYTLIGLVLTNFRKQ